MATLSIMLTALSVLGTMVSGDQTVPRTSCTNSDKGTIYDFTDYSLDGNRTINLSNYQGKVVMVVNTATYWGGVVQFHGLNALQKKYEDLEILAFPANQFELQEPSGKSEDIMNTLRYVRPGNNFIPAMTLFRRIEVNGANEHGLFTYLKGRCPATKDYFNNQLTLFYTPIRTSDIRWNYEKFLIGRDGKPVYRYDASVQPEDMQADIESLL